MEVSAWQGRLDIQELGGSTQFAATQYTLLNAEQRSLFLFGRAVISGKSSTRGIQPQTG